MLIEIHMIQNHSPANMNRDDLGAPKTCIFGGVTRARISSQCLKRSIRNPGNPDDVHKREPGMFAKAMVGHIGTKTKYFPWLVERALLKSKIPLEEHQRIVLAAQRIAVSKEREKRKAAGAQPDPRPKTAQLIHLGPGHAKYYVEKLAELRNTHTDQYKYALNPIVGFQEMVREHLAESNLDEKDQDRIVKAGWVIAKCRMPELLKVPDGQEPESEPEKKDGQPGMEHGTLIAERLLDLHLSDNKRFKDLTKGATTAEKEQLKEDAPERPKKMNEFIEALKAVNHYDAVDIALFGRMTTSDAFQDVEAAMQVAHAISTHATVNEVDYFTAVDDLGRGTGAAHVDEAMYSSACFYKYFSLDWDQLMQNLAPEPQRPEGKKDDSPEIKQWNEAHEKWANDAKPDAARLAAATLGHFIRAAAMTTPSGKQNSFASNCEPCGILVEIKKNGKMPTSYANAFAEPVERIGKPDDDAADEKSIEGRSVACLADHVHGVRRAYRIESTLCWYSPQLWRFPFRYWERTDDGKKQIPKLVTDCRFDVLDELVEKVVEEVSGLKWADVCNAGKTMAEEV